MEGESSSSQGTITRSLASKNLGVKGAVTPFQQPLLTSDTQDHTTTVNIHVHNSGGEEDEEKKCENLSEPESEENKISTNDGNLPAEPQILVIPDINRYQNRKTAGTAMMDFALLITNANQLRHILRQTDPNFDFYMNLSLVITSIILQIIVGICLALNCRYNVKHHDHICHADKINNWTTVLIFLITAINVVIPNFGENF